MKIISIFFLACALAACSTPSKDSRFPARASTTETQEAYLQKCKHLASQLNDYNSNPHQLPEAQVLAIYYYTIQGFETMNSDRKAKSECDVLAQQLLLDALDSMPGSRLTVYRGDRNRGENYKENDVQTLKRFMSTSTNKDAAEAFIIDRLWVIQTLNGKSIKDYSNAPIEGEVLLPLGTRLKITKIKHQKMDFFPEDGGKPFSRKVEVISAVEIKN